MTKLIINREKKQNILIFILFKLIIDVFFAFYIAKTYSYISGAANVNIGKLLVSWIIYLIFLYIIQKKIKNEDSYIIVGFFMIFSLVPSLSIFWMKNESISCFLLICLFWFIFIFTFEKLSNYITKINIETMYFPKKNNVIMLIVFIWLIIWTFYFTYKYGAFRLFVNFQDVYTYRLNSNNQMPSIEAYIFSWNNNVFLPLCLVFHIKWRKMISITFDLLMFLFNYSIYGNKAIFFSALVVFGLYFLYKITHGKKMVQLSMLCVIFVILIGILLSDSFFGQWIKFFSYRMFYIPNEAHYFYFDFFMHHPKLYLSQSVLKNIIDSPYDDTISIIIGSSIKYNFTGNYNNLNNGLFSDAFSNFGIFGVLLYPILLAILFRLLLYFSKNYDFRLKYSLIIILSMNVISTGFFQNLLTGGGIIIILMFILLKKNRNKIVVRRSMYNENINCNRR